MICLSETCSIVKAYMFVHLTLNKLKEEEDWLKRATLVLTRQMCPNKKIRLHPLPGKGISFFEFRSW